MKIGDLVWYWALEKHGIIVGGPWNETLSCGEVLDWDWLVMYADGELRGRETNDLKVAE